MNTVRMLTRNHIIAVFFYWFSIIFNSVDEEFVPGDRVCIINSVCCLCKDGGKVDCFLPFTRAHTAESHSSACLAKPCPGIMRRFPDGLSGVIVKVQFLVISI